MPPRKKTEAPESEQVEITETEAPESEQASSPVDVPEKATPVKPTPQVPSPAIFGATFAERRAAREGKQITGAQAENKAVQK